MIVSDLCQGSGRLPCDSSAVVDAKFTVSDPSVLEIVDRSQVPSALFDSATGAGVSNVIVHGKSKGKARLDVESTFSDGSTRTSSTDMAVLPVTRVEPLMDLYCKPNSDPAHLVPIGKQALIDVQLYNGEQVLDGAVLDAIKADGVVQAVNSGKPPMRFSWTPTKPGVLNLTSSVVKSVDIRASAVSPSEVTLQQELPAVGTALAVRLNYANSISVAQTVGGRRLCLTTEVTVMATTPDVCTGSKGELQWQDCTYNGTGIVILPLQIGTCKLTAATSGGVSSTFELSLVARN